MTVDPRHADIERAVPALAAAVGQLLPTFRHASTRLRCRSAPSRKC
jgi:hypothetical protein